MPNFLAFVLGENSELSVSEIKSYLDSKKMGYSVTAQEKEFLIIDFHNPERYSEIKENDLKEPLKICPIFIDAGELNIPFMVYIENFFDFSNNAVDFGIILYNVDEGYDIAPYLEGYVKDLLYKDRIRVGCVSPAHGAIAKFTHPSFKENEILKNAEIVIFFSKDRYYIGKVDFVRGQKI